MKNESLQKSIIGYGTQHPIMTWINDVCNIKLIKAKHLGIKHSTLNCPPLEHASLSDYTDSIFSSFNSFIPEIKLRLDADIQARLGGITKVLASEKDKELKQKREATLEEIELETSHIRLATSFTSLYTLLFGFFLVFIIYLGEVSYLANSLQVVTSSYINALLSALSISTSLILISHFAPVFINRIAHKYIRIATRVFLSLIVISLFWYVGLLRIEYINLTQHRESSVYSFVLVNSVLFFAMFLVASFLIIARIDQAKDAWLMWRQKRKLVSLEMKVKALDIAIETNQIEVTKELTERIHMMHLVEACKLLIIRLYEQAISEYCNANFIKRGVRASCFSDAIKPLDFSELQFKQYTYEND